MTTDILRDGETMRFLPDGTTERIRRDGTVVRDREGVRVPLLLMDGADGARHKPGSMPVTDTKAIEAYDAAYADYLTGLTDAWRTPPADAVAGETKPAITDARDAALAERDAALANAWKQEASA